MAVPQPYLDKIAQAYINDIKNAKIYVDDNVYDGTLNKVVRDGSRVKIFIKLNDYVGKISKITVYNKENELMYERFVDVDKIANTGYLAKIEFDIRSVEL